MGAMTTSARRLGIAVAASATVGLAAATMASAHHCYKDEWQAAAYQHHAAGGTAWMPLSDLGAMIISEDIGLPQCAYVADAVVADWMAATGTTVEPLIHSKATAGGGAAHQGKTVKPFSYLGEADFALLQAGIGAGVEECTGGAA